MRNHEPLDPIIPDVPLATALVQAWCAHEGREKALECLHRLYSMGLAPCAPPYNVLLTRETEKPVVDNDEILTLMQKHRVALDDTTYTALLDAAGNQRDFDRALKTWSEMKRRNAAPSVYSYTAMMQAAIDCEQCEYAIELFQEMKARTVRPDQVACNTALQAAVRDGQAAFGKGLPKVMHAVRVTPNANTFTLLMELASHTGQAEALEEVFALMRQHGQKPTTPVLNQRIVGLGMIGNLSAACDQVVKMHEQRAKGNWKAAPTEATYLAFLKASKLAGGSYFTGRPQTALSLLDTLKAFEPEPRDPAMGLKALNCALDACSINGNLKLATKINNLIDQEYVPDIYTHVARLRLAAFESVESAFGYYEKHVETFSENSMETAHALLTICRKKKVNRHEEVLEFLKANGVQPGGRMLHQLLRMCKDPTERAQIVTDIEQLYPVNNDHRPTARFYLGDIRYLTTPGKQAVVGYTNDLPMTLGFVEDIQTYTRYKPNLSVLPLEADHLSESERLESVQLHAEKKAIALLAKKGKENQEFFMEVNLLTCKDCRRFLQEAATYLRRKIVVKDPSNVHVFRPATS